MTMPHSNRLNDYTRAELEEALAKYLQEKVHAVTECRWCDASFTQTRRWQEFCSNSHRALWHAKAKDRVIESLQVRIRILEKDLDEARIALAKTSHHSPTDG